MRRSSQPVLTNVGEAAIAAYTRYLHDEQDVSAGTRRSYLSELRQFAAWCEASWSEGHDTALSFTPQQITTPRRYATTCFTSTSRSLWQNDARHAQIQIALQRARTTFSSATTT